MPLGIDPTVDYAFKLVFGSPDHTAVTIHFLNAVLNYPQPITSVEILNPIQGQDFDEDKLAVLDVLARDSEGRRYNIEMQTTLPAQLARRLTYYNCGNYIRQLKSGEHYEKLRPAVSICVLDAVLFRSAAEYHLSFRIRCDQQPHLVLNHDLEFHLLELPKYRTAGNNGGSAGPLEKWLYFLCNAADLEEESLVSQLGDDAYREATGVLKMISETSDQMEYYESRRRILDTMEYQLGATREEALEEGREEGRVEGRVEGLEQGVLIGKIQYLQEALGEPVTSKKELMQHELDDLSKLFTSLQNRFRSRGENADS